jgi:hypothetical protein
MSTPTSVCKRSDGARPPSDRQLGRSTSSARLARTYRFAAAVRASDAAGLGDRSEGAHRAGFYDQAHFGNELRAFTWTTPTQDLGVRRRFLREHPGHALDVGPLPAARSSSKYQALPPV